MRAGTTDRDGAECFQIPCARAQSLSSAGKSVPFDERSYNLAILAVESFGRLGMEDSDLIDRMAVSIVGKTDESSLPRKGVPQLALFPK